MTFLSIEDAIEYTGKSESTLRRLIKRLGSSKKNTAYRRKKLKNGTYKYFFNKEFLDQQFLSSLADQHLVSEKKKEEKQESIVDDTMTITMRYIESLERQLQVKDNQIAEKDKQINELIERDRENNMLLERINEALIKFRVPELIEAQTIQFKEEKQENIRQDTQGSIKKEPSSKASFTDWLNHL